MDPNRVVIQCCSINGKVCRNGKREDFPVDERTGERFHCNEWVNVKGADPQTGDSIDQWMCGREAEKKLLLEIAMMIRRNGASTDKVATEVRNQQLLILGMASPEARERLRNADLKPQIEHGGNNA